MGDTKAALTPTTSKAKKLFGKIVSKKKKPDAQVVAQAFADRLAELDADLDKLIVGKEADLRSEKGQEEKNGISLARLKLMRFHLDEVINTTADYPQS